MGRHEQREQLFKLLFRVEFHPLQDMQEQTKLFFEDEERMAVGKEASSITEKYLKIEEKLPELDRIINEKAEGWDTSRMGRVELTVLRLASYEILFDETVPAGVAIDEAVELAKQYGQDASGGFVNAVLAKYVKA